MAKVGLTRVRPMLPHRALHSWWSHLVWSSAVLKCLIILPFNLCFVNEIQWYMEHAHKLRRYGQRAYLLFPDASSHMAFEVPISTEFQWAHIVGVQQGSKQVQGEHVKSMTEQARVPAAPRNHTFLHTRIYFGNGNLRNTNYQGTISSYLFLLTSHPCVNQPLMLKMMTRKDQERRKVGQPIVPGLSSPSSSGKKSREHCGLWVRQEVKWQQLT